MSDDTELARRVDAIESRLATGQRPIRYAMAIDGRDTEAWLHTFVPDVRVGRDGGYGREAWRAQVEPVLRKFRRSMHQIVGHRIELDPADPDRASGAVYCRAEHEVRDRWIVMAICYFDQYRRVEDEWLFERRRERHWHAVDHLERPQSVGFGSWDAAAPPTLPDEFPTWASFWDTDGAG